MIESSLLFSFLCTQTSLSPHYKPAQLSEVALTPEPSDLGRVPEEWGSWTLVWSRERLGGVYSQMWGPWRKLGEMPASPGAWVHCAVASL